ncbi:MAG: hypothetical protein V3W41_21910 [Planctomycetota bacterium]
MTAPTDWDGILETLSFWLRTTDRSLTDPKPFAPGTPREVQGWYILAALVKHAQGQPGAIAWTTLHTRVEELEQGGDLVAVVAGLQARQQSRIEALERHLDIVRGGVDGMMQVLQQVTATACRNTSELTELKESVQDMNNPQLMTELREQNQRLQERCAELLRERRGIRYLVHEFHAKFGYPVRDSPRVPSDEDVRFRLTLIAEEFFELMQAALVDSGGIALAERMLAKAIRGEQGGLPPATVEVNLDEFADALADMDYVVEGTRLTCGIDGWPVLLEIQRANMSKTTKALNATDAAKMAGTTKAQKPAGWTPPNVAGELHKQGWLERTPTATGRPDCDR